MARRRVFQILLAILALFLLGTVVVLSTISFYLRIDDTAYLSEQEVQANVDANLTEVIPRILHQTWKSDTLPEKWRGVSQGCRDIMPDYKYMLWTDEGSRDFIATHYAWFIPTFDAYTYPIQRADAIRYFVLHHYGGVYLDLDIGCTKRLDPLLYYPIVLPKTIPVGVSNDLMFAEKGHPFMQQTIHNLVTFDHSWLLNYPTVMFSTGPMFLSAQYGLYNAAHRGEVRILPKSLYGKNAKPGEAPHTYFTHYYGSSWHADDAGFITFLGKRGKLLMWIGLAILVIGVARLLWVRKSKHSPSGRRRLLMGRYDIILPRAVHRNGHLAIDLGSFSLSATPATQPSSPASSSPLSSGPPSPLLTDVRRPLLPMAFEPPASPISDESTTSGFGAATSNAFRGARDWVRASWGGRADRPRYHRANSGSNHHRRRSILFFLPAIFTPSSSVHLRSQSEEDIPLSPSRPTSRNSRNSRSRSHSRHVSPARDKKGDLRSVNFDTPEDADIGASGSSFRFAGAPRPAPISTRHASSSPSPPPYERGARTPGSAWSTAWGEWEGQPTPES
ncbi:hypothetical protein SISNIDRAFT_481572 [Sistotremastrum niveocremeum HHB9708]|uniref:Glycosyltransferase family 32 protein n=1 Tax=Sistotremastrum niveocremeum HHB9708 TaxID=1314777 RepID=A0A164ZF00_9AGAM|nr:hypothetical protein SISNIDRAFT_481572 [Sistotremastrum niveocremeum HHB9708]